MWSLWSRWGRMSRGEGGEGIILGRGRRVEGLRVWCGQFRDALGILF